MNIPFFTLERQNKLIGHEIKQAISEVIDSGSYAIGSKTKEFEVAWAKYNNQRFCTLVSSGTSALEIALKCVGVKKGDDVLTTANSFIASASCINAIGANPFFIDTDDFCCIDFDKLKELIPQCTPKAIIYVTLYGNTGDLPKLREICDECGIFLILDNAQSHGCLYNGIPYSSFADISCFSHYCTKTLGSLTESGSLLTNREEFYQKALSLRNHGRDNDNNYSHSLLSGNYRSEEISAAILLVKLQYLNDFCKRRKHIRLCYDFTLRNNKNIKYLNNLSCVDWCPYVYPIFIKNRDTVRKILLENGISTNIHYPTPIPMLKCYGGKLVYYNIPKALEQCNSVLSLPFFPEMEYEEIKYVCEVLNSIP